VYGWVNQNKISFDTDALKAIFSLRPAQNILPNIKELRVKTSLWLEPCSIQNGGLHSMVHLFSAHLQSIIVTHSSHDSERERLNSGMKCIATQFPSLRRLHWIVYGDRQNNGYLTNIPEYRHLLDIKTLQHLMLKRYGDVDGISANEVMAIGRIFRVAALDIDVGKGLKEALQGFYDAFFSDLKNLTLAVHSLQDATAFINCLTNPLLESMVITYENLCTPEDLESFTNVVAEKLQASRCIRYHLTCNSFEFGSKTLPDQLDTTFDCLMPILQLSQLQSLVLYLNLGFSFIDRTVLERIACSLPKLQCLDITGSEICTKATCYDVLYTIGQLPLLETFGMRFLFDFQSSEEKLPSFPRVRVLATRFAPILSVDCAVNFIAAFFPQLRKLIVGRKWSVENKEIWEEVVECLQARFDATRPVMGMH